MYVQYLNTTQCHRPIVVVTGGFVHCSGSLVIRTVYKLALHRAQARPWPASNKSAHCQGIEGAWQRALGLPGHARWWAGRRCAVALSEPPCCLGTAAATWQVLGIGQRGFRPWGFRAAGPSPLPPMGLWGFQVGPQTLLPPCPPKEHFCT